jgi:hypothetical protein
MCLSFLLDRVALHISQQVAPLLALWGQGLMPDLQSRFPCVATPAKDLQIRQGISQIRPVADRFDMVTFKALARSAGHATPVVTLKSLQP